jgi:hypothetical protein
MSFQGSGRYGFDFLVHCLGSRRQGNSTSIERSNPANG